MKREIWFARDLDRAQRGAARVDVALPEALDLDQAVPGRAGRDLVVALRERRRGRGGSWRGRVVDVHVDELGALRAPEGRREVAGLDPEDDVRAVVVDLEAPAGRRHRHGSCPTSGRRSCRGRCRRCSGRSSRTAGCRARSRTRRCGWHARSSRRPRWPRWSGRSSRRSRGRRPRRCRWRAPSWLPTSSTSCGRCWWPGRRSCCRVRCVPVTVTGDPEIGGEVDRRGDGERGLALGVGDVAAHRGGRLVHELVRRDVGEQPHERAGRPGQRRCRTGRLAVREADRSDGRVGAVGRCRRGRGAPSPARG